MQPNVLPGYHVVRGDTIVSRDPHVFTGVSVGYFLKSNFTVASIVNFAGKEFADLSDKRTIRSVLGTKKETFFSYESTTKEAAWELVFRPPQEEISVSEEEEEEEEDEDDWEPHAVHTLDINDAIRHEMISNLLSLADFVSREQQLGEALFQAETKEELVSRAEGLVLTEDLNWDLIWDRANKQKEMLGAAAGILEFIYMQVIGGADLKNEFLSVLRWHEDIFCIVATTISQEDAYYEHNGIVKTPSMWMYAVSHPEIACLSSANMSMLLYSATAHAITEMYPSIKEVRISTFLPRMRDIFMKSSRDNDFNVIQDAVDGVRVSLSQANFVNLWRKWTTPSQPCNSCLAQVQWTCMGCDVARYCSDACAEEHWEQHSGRCAARVP